MAHGFGQKGQKSLTPRQRFEADRKAWLKSPSAKLDGDNEITCLTWDCATPEQREWMDLHATLALRMAGLAHVPHDAKECFRSP